MNKIEVANKIISFLRENKCQIIDLSVGYESTPYAAIDDCGADFFREGIVKILDSCVQTKETEGGVKA